MRRLLRFDHRSHIGQIEAALARIGGRLELKLRPVREERHGAGRDLPRATPAAR